MNMLRLLIATVILSVAATSAYSQTYVISPGGEYDYLVSGESPGVPECQPDLFLCQFGVGGTVTIAADATSLVFNGADFTLTGNEAVQANASSLSPLTGAGAAARLIQFGDSLAFVSDIGGVLTYQRDTAFNFQTNNLTAIIDGDELQVTGGFDFRPVDGDGFDLNFTATQVVPEPASASLLGMGIVVAFLGRRRRHVL